MLVAKTLSDFVELPPKGTENIRLYTLQHRNSIDTFLYELARYAHLPQETLEQIYRLVDEFLMWRYHTAYMPQAPFFSGDTNTVVDDLSGLLKFVNIAEICPVGDMIDQANHSAGMLRELARCVL